LKIEKKDVHLRLAPNPRDVYYWKLADSADKRLLGLFMSGSKSLTLSSRSMSEYEELRQWVGTAFEAALCTAPGNDDEPAGALEGQVTGRPIWFAWKFAKLSL
jgi:hypothetical protein